MSPEAQFFAGVADAYMKNPTPERRELLFGALRSALDYFEIVRAEQAAAHPDRPIVAELERMLTEMDDSTPILREWRHKIEVAIRCLRERGTEWPEWR